MKKMNENSKVTLTMKQLKRLVKEAASPFKINGDTLVEYTGGGSNVVIPNGIRKIARDAFSQTKIKSVVIPDSVEVIGTEAFSACFKLTSVTIPDSVKRIEDGAFSACTRLTSITIPSGVTTLGMDAFGGCINLKDVTILNPKLVKMVSQDPNGFFEDTPWAIAHGTPDTDDSERVSVSSGDPIEDFEEALEAIGESDYDDPDDPDGFYADAPENEYYRPKHVLVSKRGKNVVVNYTAQEADPEEMLEFIEGMDEFKAVHKAGYKITLNLSDRSGNSETWEF